MLPSGHDDDGAAGMPDHTLHGAAGAPAIGWALTPCAKHDQIRPQGRSRLRTFGPGAPDPDQRFAGNAVPDMPAFELAEPFTRGPQVRLELLIALRWQRQVLRAKPGGFVDVQEDEARRTRSAKPEGVLKSPQRRRGKICGDQNAPHGRLAAGIFGLCWRNMRGFRDSQTAALGGRFHFHS